MEDTEFEQEIIFNQVRIQANLNISERVCGCRLRVQTKYFRS